jgi:DNA-binding response OmpR family regulator
VERVLFGYRFEEGGWEMRDQIVRLMRHGRTRSRPRPVVQSTPQASVLLVHPHPGERNALATALTDAGYTIDTRSDGVEALRCCATQNFDVVISAVVMPRLDGLELLRTLRERTPQTPVIVLSTGTEEIDGVYLRYAELMGAAATYKTPVSPSNLLDGVRQVLREREQTAD